MHHHWPLKISAHGGLRWQKMQKFHNRNCEIEACLYSGTGARQKDGLINERHSLITCDFRILSKSSHGLQMVGVLPFQDLTKFTTPRSSNQLFAALWTILNKIFWKELKLSATHMGKNMEIWKQGLNFRYLGTNILFLSVWGTEAWTLLGLSTLERSIGFSSVLYECAFLSKASRTETAALFHKGAHY